MVTVWVEGVVGRGMGLRMGMGRAAGNGKWKMGIEDGVEQSRAIALALAVASKLTHRGRRETGDGSDF